jgi:hypothetical protein
LAGWHYAGQSSRHFLYDAVNWGRFYLVTRFKILLDMNEHRAAPRRRIFKAGSISCGGETIDCTVRRISETGAALEVVTPLFIPDRFRLIVETDGFNRPCRVVWRKQNRLGVAFD